VQCSAVQCSAVQRSAAAVPPAAASSMAEQEQQHLQQQEETEGAQAQPEAAEQAMEAMDEAQLGAVLLDRAAKIGARMRAVFFLRTKGGEPAVEQLCKALAELKGDSSLLRHELAYCIGQLQLPSAVPTLCQVLRDTEDCPVVRHESAEALAAIGDVSTPVTLEILEEFCNDARPEVSETCKIAVDRVKMLVVERAEQGPDATAVPAPDDQYNSVDPAPPIAEHKTVEELVETLLNQDLELFHRYQAMFALRNTGTEAAVLGLASGLKDSSALFRHEIAFILGQMAHPASFEALKESLSDGAEHAMVRHEAAEAIGAIVDSITPDDTAPSRGDCVALLRQYLADEEPLVSESCETALDSIEYWDDFNSKAHEQAVDA